MKRIVGLLVVLGVGLMPLRAQTTRAIRQLEQQRNELKEQIAASETLLQSTKKDVKSQLADLALITGQIDERQKYLNTIESDVQTIQQEVDRLQTELSRLEKELADKKAKYERSVKYMYRNKSIQEKLMFIFSADNLTQMYRRMRYVREYADFQRLQGIQVQRKQQQVTAKQHTLVASRKAKEELLAQGEAEKQKLQEQEQQRKTLVASLQKKQRSLQSELNKQRKSANKLNAQIDRLIEIEIEKPGNVRRNGKQPKPDAWQRKKDLPKLVQPKPDVKKRLVQKHREARKKMQLLLLRLRKWMPIRWIRMTVHWFPLSKKTVEPCRCLLQDLMSS